MAKRQQTFQRAASKRKAAQRARMLEKAGGKKRGLATAEETPATTDGEQTTATPRRTRSAPKEA